MYIQTKSNWHIYIVCIYLKLLRGEYENYLALFASLGYFSYVNVNKERIVYSTKNKMYEYNVMIDNIKNSRKTEQ